MPRLGSWLGCAWLQYNCTTGNASFFCGLCLVGCSTILALQMHRLGSCLGCAWLRCNFFSTGNASRPLLATAALRPAAHSASVVRWSSLLAVAAQCAFAASLLELPRWHHRRGGAKGARQLHFASSLLQLPLDTVAFAAGEPAVHEVCRTSDRSVPRLPAASQRGLWSHMRDVACRCTEIAHITVAKSVREKNQHFLAGFDCSEHRRRLSFSQ